MLQEQLVIHTTPSSTFYSKLNTERGSRQITNASIKTTKHKVEKKKRDSKHTKFKWDSNGRNRKYNEIIHSVKWWWWAEALQNCLDAQRIK